MRSGIQITARSIEPANMVNAEFIAQQCGMTIVEKMSVDAGDYNSQVVLTFLTAKNTQTVGRHHYSGLPPASRQLTAIQWTLCRRTM
jgi:hypothetical protein